MRILVFKEKN